MICLVIVYSRRGMKYVLKKKKIYWSRKINIKRESIKFEGKFEENMDREEWEWKL